MKTTKKVKEKKAGDVLNRARNLVNTSVQDMESGLHAYFKREDLRVLGAAWNIASSRGEKTKAVILARRIKQVKKGLGI